MWESNSAFILALVREGEQRPRPTRNVLLPPAWHCKPRGPWCSPASAVGASAVGASAVGASAVGASAVAASAVSAPAVGARPLHATGENSIIIVGGANQAEWALSDAAKAQVAGAGAVLLQREIPEHVNAQVAKVRAVLAHDASFARTAWRVLLVDVQVLLVDVNVLLVDVQVAKVR